jgi:atypical dual specificity phosphatase
MLRENMYDEIIEHLYIGSASALNHRENFKLIVNCTTNVYIKSSVKTIRIPIDDDPYDTNLFLQLLDDTNVLQEINTSIINKEPVLVHCYAGQQRSCALVTCYLMKYNNMTPDTAINYIKQKRRVAFIGNVTFISAIIHFFHYKLSANNKT